MRSYIFYIDPDNLPIIVWVVIMRISVVRGFCEEMANTALPPVADDGSTKSVRITPPVVNRRGGSGSAPYQADLAIEIPTHRTIRVLRAHPGFLGTHPPYRATWMLQVRRRHVPLGVRGRLKRGVGARRAFWGESEVFGQ